MSRPRFRPTHRAALLLASSLVAFTAWSALAARWPSDRAVAEQLLAGAVPAAGSGSYSVPATPVREAKRALERADRARAAGDTAHADQLEGLAREWAEFARDASRAHDAERRAAAAQSAAAEAATRSKRARALLEEQMAKRARAQGELKTLQESAATGVGSEAVRVMQAGHKGAAAAKRPSSKPSASAAPSAAPAGEEP